jgi:hypothetical protein
MNQLPDDCLTIIVSYLDNVSLFVGRFVCQKFRNLIVVLLRERTKYQKSFDYTTFIVPESVLHREKKFFFNCNRDTGSVLLDYDNTYQIKYIKIGNFNCRLVASGIPTTIGEIKIIIHNDNKKFIKSRYVIDDEITFIEIIKNIIVDLDNVFTESIKKNYLNIVKWACQMKYERPNNACFYAALNGHFKLLKWLVGNGFPGSKKMYSGAAVSGNLNILKWLHKSGYIVPKNCIEYAAQGGHLDTLQWLIHRYPHINQRFIKYAIHKGNFEMVKWIFNNCIVELDYDCYIIAICNPNYEVFKFIKTRVPYYPSNRDNIAKLKWPKN